MTVEAQPERLGWVDNINYLIDRAGTPYYCIFPHDDLPAPDYVAVLLRHLSAHPEAVVAYCDMKTFGERPTAGQRIRQSTVGSLAERLVSFMAETKNAVAFRGLVAKHRLPRPIRVPHNDAGDIAADTLYILEMAVIGELQRVPDFLYRKRLHPESESWSWRKRDDGERLDAWAIQSAECARIALRAVTDPADIAPVTDAIERRLLRIGFEEAFWLAKSGALSRREIDRLCAVFEARTGLKVDRQLRRQAEEQSPKWWRRWSR